VTFLMYDCSSYQILLYLDDIRVGTLPGSFENVLMYCRNGLLFICGIFIFNGSVSEQQDDNLCFYGSSTT